MNKPKKEIDPTTMSFDEAYAILEQGAQIVSQPCDFDTLLSTIERASVAYKVCQARLDALDTAIETAFASA